MVTLDHTFFENQMRYLQLVLLTGVSLVVIVITTLGQDVRQYENSLHNLQPANTLVQTKDSTSASFKDKLLFEIVGGPSMCFFTRGDEPDQIMFHRYALAFALVYRITKTLNLEAKILWEPKGVLTEYNFDDLLYKQGIKLDYLTLALSVDHYVDCQRRLYIGAGASVGMLARQWNFAYAYDDNGRKVSSYGVKDNTYRKFEMGLIANIGYRRNVWNNISVNVQAFANFGITDVTKKLEPDPYPMPYSNANLALLIGIGFGPW